MLLKLPPRNSAVDFSEHGYIIEEFVGKGQFGRAYKVRFQPDNSIWLAKSIDLCSLDQKDKLSSLQEAGVMQTLKHPGIVEWRESFVHRDMFLVIIMEFCKQGDLASKMEWLRAEKKKLNESEVIHIISQLAEALNYIHSKNILHRDIKPSNIFLTENGDIKIGDFGISRVMTSTLSHASTTVGTPQYMAPEMCENKPYTYKTDIWAFGCVIYELVALKCAFQADSFLALAWAITSLPPPTLPSEFSTDLQMFIQSLLHKVPSSRPSAAKILSTPFIRNYRLNCASLRQICISSPDDDWNSTQEMEEYALITPALQGGSLAARERTELKQKTYQRSGTPPSFRSYQFYVVLARFWRAFEQYGDKSIWSTESTTFFQYKTTDQITSTVLKNICVTIQAPVSDIELDLVLDRLALTLDNHFISIWDFREALLSMKWRAPFDAATLRARKLFRETDLSVDKTLLLGGFLSFDHRSTGEITREAFRSSLHIFFPELSYSDVNFLFYFSPKSGNANVMYRRLIDDDIFNDDVLSLDSNTVSDTISNNCSRASSRTDLFMKTHTYSRINDSSSDQIIINPWADKSHEQAQNEWSNSQHRTTIGTCQTQWCWTLDLTTPPTSNRVDELWDTPERLILKKSSNWSRLQSINSKKIEEEQLGKYIQSSRHRCKFVNEDFTKSSKTTTRRMSYPLIKQLDEVLLQPESKIGVENKSMDDVTRFKLTIRKGYSHPLVSSRTRKMSDWIPREHHNKQHRSSCAPSDASTGISTSISPGSCATPCSNIVDLFKSLGAAFTGLRERRSSVSPISRHSIRRSGSSGDSDWKTCHFKLQNLETPYEMTHEPTDEVLPRSYLPSVSQSQENIPYRSSSERAAVSIAELKSSNRTNYKAVEHSLELQQRSSSAFSANGVPETLDHEKSSDAKLYHRRAIAGRFDAALSVQTLVHVLQAERTASCRLVSALSSQPSQASTIEKGFSRLLEARRRSDDALGSSMRTVMLSFHAEKVLVGNSAIREPPAFTSTVEAREGCLLLRGLCVVLSQHRGTVDRFTRNRAGGESPWSSISSSNDDDQINEELIGIWSSRFLFITESLTREISRLLHWEIQQVSALKHSPSRAFQSINQLKELLSSQVGFFAARHPGENLKGDWEAARLFMGLVVARKSTAASMGGSILSGSDNFKGAQTNKTSSNLNELEARLLHITDQETISKWTKLSLNLLSRLQVAATKSITDLEQDFQMDYEEPTTSSCRNDSYEFVENSRRLSLPHCSTNTNEINY